MVKGNSQAIGLNPLKAGQWFGRKRKDHEKDRKIGLNPLKAGQWFGQ